MCNDSFSKILAFIGALILGVVTAILYACGILCEIHVLICISLALAVLTMILLLVLLFHSQHGMRCICRYASALFYALVLTIVLAALALAMSTCGCWIFTIILIGAWATLGFYALILFCMLISCFISARCGCGSSGENRCSNNCSNNSCRFG